MNKGKEVVCVGICKLPVQVLLLPLNQVEMHLRFEQFNFHRNLISSTLCYIKKKKRRMK